MSSFLALHIQVAEQVLKYLCDTWNESITYTRGSRNPNEVWGWIDADWAGNTDTHRSHTGYILMNGGPISWKRHSQDNVSLSTSEAGFVDTCPAGQEALCLRETLKDSSLVISNRIQPKSIRIIWPVLP